VDNLLNFMSIKRL